MSVSKTELFSPFSGSFPQFQEPFHGCPNEGRAVLVLLQNGVHAVKGALREACRRLLMVDLLSAHGRNIDDITNCYKGYFCRYHLLHSLGLLISSKHQQRR